MKLIGLSGKRGSGKTSLGALLHINYDWNHLALAMPIKAMCRQDFGMTEAQTDGAMKEVVDTRYNKSPREIMILIGKGYRYIDQDFWIRKLSERILDDKINVISDVRFKNEAEWIKKHGGVIVRLERDAALSPYQGEIDDPSETELDSYTFDMVNKAENNRNMDDLYSFAHRLHFAYDTIHDPAKAY